MKSSKLTRIIGTAVVVACLCWGYAFGEDTDNLVVTENGNVGIGAANPAIGKLQVHGGQVPAAFLTPDMTSGQISEIYVGKANSGYQSLALGYVHNDTAADRYAFMRLWGYQDANSIVLSGNGNVGIGTAQPGEKLEIVGNLRFTNAGSMAKFPNNIDIRGGHSAFGYGPGLAIDIPSPGAFEIVKHGTGPVMVVRDDGKVGIGTANPVAQLDVQQGGAIIKGVVIGNDAPGIDYPFEYESVGVNGANLNLRLQSPNSIIFHTGDSLGGKFIVSEGGNVGIGTTNPHQQLSLTGAIGFANQNDTDKKLHSPSDGVLEWVTHDWAAEHGFAVSHQGERRVYFNTKGKSYINGGNVGINTQDPRYLLDVNGTIRGENVSPSDARWKEDVDTLENALDRITKVRGVTFHWKDGFRGDGSQMGVIAQEVETVFPELVSTDAGGYKSVAYGRLVAPLIEAVKTLKAENESLKFQLDALHARMARLEAKFARE